MKPLAWIVVGAVVIGLATQIPRFIPAAANLLPGAADVPVRLMTVAERSASEPMAVHTATGKIVSDHKVKVATKVSGQIVELFFEQGDAIQEGQILAKIEDVLPRARRDEAAATLEKSKAALDFQRVNFDRIKLLHSESNAPDIEFQDARRALEEAQAEVQKNEAVLAWSQKILRDCEVLAPISGVILERNVEVGDFVAAEGGLGANANSQFGTIADMEALRVEVDVSELDIARLKQNMKCVITPDAYKDQRFEGHVMWIDPGANYSKATVQVKVRIENPDRNYLRVEGVAQVVFLASNSSTGEAGSNSTNPSGVWIPSTACILNDSGDTARVFIADNGKLREATVTIGRRIAGQYEIKSGLRVGQSIASDNLEKLTDGQRIDK